MNNQETQGTKNDVDSASVDRVVMPWDKRAIELEPIEGHYSHYAAWKEWFAEWNARQSSALELDLDELDTVALYAAFCAACSECSSA